MKVNIYSDILDVWQLITSLFFFFNWDTQHARLNSYYEAWSYKKKKHKNISIYTGNLFRKNLQLKDVPLNSRLTSTEIIGQRKAF